jgi:hypothetical protein
MSSAAWSSKVVRKLSVEQTEKLDSVEWLTEQHFVNRLSAGEIAQQLQVHVTVVSKRLQKHSIPRPTQQQLREAALMRKHGVTNSSKVEGSRQKALSTMDAKYGGHNFQAGENRVKFRDEPLLDKYGTVNTSALEETKDKARLTNVARYGYVHKNKPSFSSEQLAALNKDYSLTDVARHLNSSISVVSRLYDVYGIDKVYHHYSSEEQQVADFVSQLGVDVVRNSRKIISNGQELDLYFPEQKLAIEYCGTFWHSEYAQQDRLYHRRKYELCREQDIQLLTIYSDEWSTRREQVQNKIKHALNQDGRRITYARNTYVAAIDKHTAREVIDQTHIQKSSSNGFAAYALKTKAEESIVAVVVLKRVGNEITIDRYATTDRVVGGFGKLLKHVRTIHKTARITTFADLRWSTGNLYEKAGLTAVKHLPPDYRYVDARTGQTYHKFMFRHKHLATRFANYNPSLSEHQNCANNHFYRIWNCGLIKYEAV